MKSLLIAPLVVATLLASSYLPLASAERRGPSWSELKKKKYSFEEWAEDFGRVYDNEDERLMRKSVFETRLADIIRHNDDPKQTYKRGVNQFSDWTMNEWKEYNRLVPHEIEKKAGGAATAPSATFRGTPGKTVNDLPKLVDYRTWTSPPVLTGIKNQGKCGNCFSWSATEGIESYFALATGQLPVLSAQQITSCNMQSDGCGGGSIRNSWDYVANTTGLNEEWVYPFTDFFSIHDRRKYTAPCKNITQEFNASHWTWWPKAGVSSYVNVEINNALATMEALATKGPLSIGVASALWIDYEGGILHNNKSHGGYATWDNWGIDHAVQLIGYGYDFDQGLEYWIVKNSWGTTWGEDGFIRLYRTSNPADEPCGVYPVTNGTVCGTSSVLAEPAYPIVHTLKKKN